MYNTYKRTMGATERMRLWLPNINVVMAARLEGEISESELRAAILKARRKHPLLGACVTLNEDGEGWFITEGVPDIPITVLPQTTDDTWLQQMHTEISRRWSIQTGPLCHFVLIQGTQTADIVITAHHSICDGRSLAYLLRDMLSYIHQPVADTSIEPVVPVPLEAAVPASASGGALYRFFMGLMNKKWLRRGITFSEDDYAALHQTFWETHQATIISEVLSEVQTTRLVSHCKQKHVSVNSALYAAFLAAQQHVQGADRDDFYTVLVPVDFRHYLTQRVDGALGLYASALHLRFVYASEEPFWDMAQRLDDEVQRQLTDKNIFASQRTNALHPSLLDGIGFAMSGGTEDAMAKKLAERVRGKMRTGILVSNLGRLDMPVDYGDLHLKALIPPAIYAGNAEKALEALTVGGRLHLTLTFDTAVVARETVIAVKDKALQYLI